MGKLEKVVKQKLRKLYNPLLESYYMFCYRHLPLKNNLIFLDSRNGKEIAGNIYRIIMELSNEQYKNFKLILSINKNSKSEAKKILCGHNLNVKLVITDSKNFFKYLATSKYLIADTSFNRRFIKREGQLYLNTWHGTPLKKMGRDNISGIYNMGNIQRNLLMSDYILFPSEYMKKVMTKAYMLDHIFQGKYLCEGYPRNTIFFNVESRKKIRKTLNIDNKIVLVYMPTWREQNKAYHTELLNTHLQALDEQLDDNQILLVKLHPLSQVGNIESYRHIKIFPPTFEAYEILNCADILITDYSSVFFDFANTRRKIILFVYDQEEYLSNRGLYINLNELPFPKVYTISELINEINRPFVFNYETFIEKYCTYEKQEATSNICKHFILNQKTSLESEPCSNKKENILFYAGDLAKNGITTALLALFKNIDTTKYNYFISFRETILKKSPQNLLKVPANISILPLASDAHKTLFEAIADKLFYRYKIENSVIQYYRNRLYKREVKKHFASIPFRRVIQYNGYEIYTISLFERFRCKRAIWVHNDMTREITLRHNQNGMILKEAYNQYDFVIAVTQDLVESITSISGNSKNIWIINNIYDYQTILDKGNDSIKFQKDTVCRPCPPSGFNSLIDSNETKFITIGRFSPEKGHLRLLSAFEQFVKDYPNSRLIIIGGHGKLYLKTLRQIQKMECWEKVTLIMSIENPMPILKKCDLFVLPSLYEGFGLVLVEADVLGLPVISTNITGPRTFMLENHGYLVDDSTEGILQGMYDFMEGKVKKMQVDYERYNQQTIQKFNQLVESNE